MSGSRHARKSLGEGEAGLAARGPFHWPSQLVSASRLVCCAQVPESGDKSSRVTLANHCAIPAIYEDREFVDDVGGSMSYECISSNQPVYRPSTKLLAIAVIE
jgi:hypothetical protein